MSGSCTPPPPPGRKLEKDSMDYKRVDCHTHILLRSTSLSAAVEEWTCSSIIHRSLWMNDSAVGAEPCRLQKCDNSCRREESPPSVTGLWGGMMVLRNMLHSNYRCNMLVKVYLLIKYKKVWTIAVSGKERVNSSPTFQVTEHNSVDEKSPTEVYAETDTLGSFDLLGATFCARPGR